MTNIDFDVLARPWMSRTQSALLDDGKRVATAMAIVAQGMREIVIFSILFDGLHCHLRYMTLAE
ncbi:hypothetical protein ACOI1H_18440 [Loktanella sp. DJP18]|uniref:hypothetical protein n=1 Tax=Loktanella sp. DJP18 TaxID=3409788 RepID=UPI003BB7FFDC